MVELGPPPRVSKERVLETLHLKLRAPEFYPDPRKGLPAEVAMAGVLSCAKRVSRNVRPMSLGKKRVSAPEEHGGVGIQSPTQGLQR